MGGKLRTTLPVQPKLLNSKWPGLGKVASREKIIKQKQKLYYDKRHRARALKPFSKMMGVYNLQTTMHTFSEALHFLHVELKAILQYYNSIKIET